MTAARSADVSGERLALFLVLTPFLLWVLLLVVIPHVDLLILSLREKIAPRVYVTLAMSILATAITLLVAFPVAYYIAKIARGRTRNILFLACLLPFWVSELVRVFGWMILLRETGVVSSFLVSTGLIRAPIELLYNDAIVMIGLVYTSILFMVVPLISSLDSLDDSHVEAGYDLGGNAFAILREIIIPHAMPGIVAGSIVVFMLSLGNYLTPALLGGKSSQWFTAHIYSQFITRFNWEVGSAFGFVLLLTSSLVVWLALRLTGQSLSSTLGRA